MKALVSCAGLALLLVYPAGCGTPQRRAESLDSYSLGMKKGLFIPEINAGDPVLLQRKIFLNGQLNEFTAGKAIQELLYLDSKDHLPIDLILNTPGGDLEQAFAVIDVMRSIRSPVNTWALARCHSSGLFVLVAATGKRYVYPRSLIFLHGPVVQGRVPVRVPALISERCRQLLKQFAMLPEEWLPLQPDAHHVLTPEEALQYGLVDEIVRTR